MAKILTNSDKGREIFNYLVRELGVPKGCTRLIVTLEMDDIIRYSGDFMAESKSDTDDTTNRQQ